MRDATLNNTCIGFIGGGQIASCLIAGLLDRGAAAANLHIAEPSVDARAALSAKHPTLNIHSSSDALIEPCATLIVCVKPNVVRAVCDAIAPRLTASADDDARVLVSVAAGISLSALRKWTRDDLPIVRGMPNTPAQIGRGMSVLCANARVRDAQRHTVETIFASVGATLWIDDETKMDLITALSGSGPAYLFRVMEALEKAARDLGLPADVAHRLVAQTMLGGAHLAAGDTPLDVLRERVTSKKGVTERGLAELDAADIDALFHRLLDAAQKRARELSREAETE